MLSFTEENYLKAIYRLSEGGLKAVLTNEIAESMSTKAASVTDMIKKLSHVNVFVDETRPVLQGARLTAWEMRNEGISHRIIADNAAGFLMSRGEVDLVIVGADRITRNGDVVNKIGTLEKALCAQEFGVPFYVAAPSSTFDLECASGADVPIEYRGDEEMHYQVGPDVDGIPRRIRVTAPGSPVLNPAFDVTPSRLVTGIITERGIVRPGETSGSVEMPTPA